VTGALLPGVPRVRVRAAQPADAQAMARVHYHAVHSKGAGFYPLATLEHWSPLPDEARYQRLRQAIRGGRELFRVAEDDSGVIGFGSIVPGALELRSLYVHAAAGQRGVGAALLAELEALAGAQGCAALNLEAALNSEGFYRRHGYLVVAAATHTLADGSPLACIRMCKQIR
jgi:ribosomal protein S18 acetylase RimI-like enzyme